MPRRLNAVGPTKKIGRTLVRKKLRISEIVRSGLPTSETFLLSSFTTASYRYRRITTTGFVYVLRVWPDPISSPTSACTVVRRNGRSEVTQHPLEPLWDESRRTAEILRRDGHVTDLPLRVDQTDGTGQATTGTPDLNTKFWAFTNDRDGSTRCRRTLSRLFPEWATHNNPDSIPLGDNLFGACGSRREGVKVLTRPARTVPSTLRRVSLSGRGGDAASRFTREVWVGGVWR